MQPAVLPTAPNAAWNLLEAVVSAAPEGGVRLQGPLVPPSFLATSHEWTRIADWGANLPAFTNVFSTFGPQPLLRIVGASQDSLKAVPPPETWKALAQLHNATGCRYLLGLPLLPVNAPQLAHGMMAAAATYLPAGVVEGFELGQEPEFWGPGLGGYSKPDPRRPTDASDAASWTPGFEAFTAYAARVASLLSPSCSAANKGAAAVPPLMGGPGWGNVNTLDAKLLANYARATKCSLREVVMHYYPYVDNRTIDATGLLEEPLLRFGLSKFTWLAGVAAAQKMPMRISETGSLYGGGRAGLNDRLAGALWIADAAFEFARAGAAGFHLHWGIGGDPSGRGQPNTGIFTVFDPDTRQPYPSVHTPWLGHLLFLGATCQGGATPAARAAGVSAACSRAAPSAMRFAEVVLNTQGGCSANMKVWALTDTSSGQLRVVVLNKDGAMPCNVALGLPAAPAPAPAGAWGSAAVYQLLPGKAGLLSSINTGALWQGVTYYGSRNAMPSSDVLRAQRVTAERAASGGSVFTVAMPAASAALLVINPKAAAGAAAEGPSAA